MTTRNFRVNNGLEVGDITISASANTITGLATAAPSADGDVANKKYVDDKANITVLNTSVAVADTGSNGTITNTADGGAVLSQTAATTTVTASGAINLTAGTDVVVPANVGVTFGTGEKIEGDNTDLTVTSGAKINLTAGTDVHIPQNIGLVFDANGSEKIESNDTDLTINSGAKINLTATSDVHIPQNIGLVFDANGSEKIESNDTDLTINSGAKINLTATSDVHIPKNIGIVFDDNASEKIESNDTDLTISSGAKIKLTATSDVEIPNDVGIAYGTGGEKIESDGTDLTVTSTGVLNLTATGDTAITNNATIGGNLVLTGNLTVNGNTSTVSSTNTTIADNIIELNTGISASSNDAGIIIERGSTGNNAAIIFDESADKFAMGLTTSTAADKSGGITVSTGTLLANLEGNVTGDLTGTASLATSVTVADESSDTSCNVLFVTAATGDLGPKAGTNLTFNSSSGVLTATGFAGALTGNVTGTADVATVATTVTITDNESTDEDNAIIFTAGGDIDGGNLGLESDGTCTYNPSTGKITATGFVGALTGNVTGTADVATAVTVADESSDTSCNVLFVTAATGDLPPKSGTNLTFNSSSGVLTATGFAGPLTGNVTGTADVATVATTVTITDNESTNENNPVVFVAGGDLDGGNLGLESDGTCTYNPSTGKITATGFIGDLTGTASAAEYSDVAERFASDTTYEPGTVVALGGSEEITQVNEEGSDEVFGVVSSLKQAAFKMNAGAGDDDTHPYIAMTGRVNVKVIGTVNKGDRLISASVPGYARAATKAECTAFNVIGRALTGKTEAGQGSVKAAVRVSH